MKRSWTSWQVKKALGAGLLMGMVVGLPAMMTRHGVGVEEQGRLGEIPVVEVMEKMGRMRPRSEQMVREASEAWLALDYAQLPHGGMSSRQMIHMAVGDRVIVDNETWNCFQSVSHACNGDRFSNVFHNWPEAEVYVTGLEEAGTWEKIEESLKVGDVVGFWIYESIHGSAWTPTETHVQICTGERGRMWAANNEPRFVVERGIPCQTGMWCECKSRAYFEALKGSDKYWQALGYDRYYFIKVYHRPTGGGGVELAVHKGKEAQG